MYHICVIFTKQAKSSTNTEPEIKFNNSKFK